MRSNSLDQIRVNKARYCRYLDTKQWMAFANLLMPDASVRIIDPNGVAIAEFDSSAAFVMATRHFLDGARSIHQVHNDELTLRSNDEVAAIWSMEDYIVFPDERAGPATLHGYGHYFETWVLSEGVWRLARMELRRTILEQTAARNVKGVSYEC